MARDTYPIRVIGGVFVALALLVGAGVFLVDVARNAREAAVARTEPPAELIHNQGPLSAEASRSREVAGATAPSGFTQGPNAERQAGVVRTRASQGAPQPAPTRARRGEERAAPPAASPIPAFEAAGEPVLLGSAVEGNTAAAAEIATVPQEEAAPMDDPVPVAPAVFEPPAEESADPAPESPPPSEPPPTPEPDAVLWDGSR